MPEVERPGVFHRFPVVRRLVCLFCPLAAVKRSPRTFLLRAGFLGPVHRLSARSPLEPVPGKRGPVAVHPLGLGSLMGGRSWAPFSRAGWGAVDSEQGSRCKGLKLRGVFSGVRRF